MNPKKFVVVLAATFAAALTILAVPASAAVVNTVPQISGGYNQMCLLSQMGVLRCMGANDHGQLGPNGVGANLESPTVMDEGSPVTSVGVGSDQVCVTLLSGPLHCRGGNYRGQLGTALDTLTTTPHPFPITPPLPAAAIVVDANQLDSCAILTGGSVYCWGVNEYAQLGFAANIGTVNPNPTPTQVALPAAATKIAVGPFHACSLLVNGQSWCWGENFYGKLGTATNSATFTPNLPIQADLVGTGMTTVSTFGTFTCYTSAAHNADCVGLNQLGQLGSTLNNGTGAANPSPQTAPLGGDTVVDVAAMSDAACALMASGVVACYGNNDDGELGNTTDMNTSIAHPTPAYVAGMPAPAIAIGNGINFICAVLKTGAVYCWGLNGSGQLGQSSALVRTGTPVLVPGVNLLDAPPAITLNQGKLKFKFKKSRRKILATATIPYTGSSTLDAAKCTGSVATVLYGSKKVKKKTKTKRYAKKSFPLGLANNTCRIKVSLKLSASAKGKKLKFSTAYAGATYAGSADVSPYSRISTVKVPKKIHK